MGELLRNLILAMIGIVVIIGLATAGVLVAAVLAGAGALFWVLLKLRQKGIIKGPAWPPQTPQDTNLITDVDYEVLSVKETRDEKDRV